MDLDISVCLKSLRNVFQQFRSSPTEQAAKELERELDLLIGITSHGNDKALEDFSPKTLLHADSVSIFVNILNDSKLKANIQSKAMILLSFLAENEQIRKSLQDTFKLTPTLVNFLVQRSLITDESVILQCLQLLQQITYEQKIRHSPAEVENLMKYLVSKINSTESSLTMPCLGSLANLCRFNTCLHDHIKSMSNMKGFFRRVTEFLCHDNWMKIIHSLSILLIFVDEPLGEKVFNKKNINEIFQLVFNVILKGDGEETKVHSCNLFIDLIKCEKMRKYLSAYSDLPFRLRQIISLLKTSEKDSVDKILELFIELCEIKCLQNFVVKAVFDDDIFATNSDKHVTDSVCLSTIIDVMTLENNKQGSKTTYLALKLIKNFYKIVVSADMSFDAEMLNMQLLLPVLSSNLAATDDEDDLLKMEESMKNTRCCLEILILFCRDKSIFKMMINYINVNSLAEMVSHIYQRFGSDGKHRNIFKEKCWNVISSVVIGLIELISLLEEMEVEKAELPSLLQSSELSGFLAACLCSGSKDLIKSSMEIITKANHIQDFSIERLCELIASNTMVKNENKSTFHQENHSIEGPFSFQPISYELSSNTKAFLHHRKVTDEKSGKNNDQKDIVDDLAERTSSALEIKDGCAMYEVMEIYEHKLAAMERNKSHLQELLDSKTSSLGQADQLLADYRCNNAQLEAECLKLRSLLIENQKLCEEGNKQVRAYSKELERMKSEVESLIEENKSLDTISEEYEQLKIACQNQTEKLLTLESKLSAAEEDQSNFSEMNKMLRKHNDNLKTQYDCFQQQLRKLETENQNISSKLKEKDQKCEELTKEVVILEKIKREKQETESKLKIAEEKLEITEKEKEELSENIGNMENEIKHLQETVEEYDELKLSYQEQNQRLENAKRSLEVAETENKSLSDMESMLRKQGESLKIKHEGVLQQLKESEKEKQSVVMKLKEKEKKIEVFTKTISSLKEDIKLRENGKLEVEQNLKKCEKQLKQTEKTKSELNHKVSSLKLLNEKYEKEIQVKDDKLKQMKSKLDKQSQIAAMIHNLSSGQTNL